MLASIPFLAPPMMLAGMHTTILLCCVCNRTVDPAQIASGICPSCEHTLDLDDLRRQADRPISG